jgi:uncharacterized membrane protein YbaN (DUF454 family)
LAGIVLVGIGFVGVFTPGLPTTVFLIMALYCFKKSSPRLERWLLGHKWFGPALTRWETDRSMTRRSKTVALTVLWACLAVSFALVAWPKNLLFPVVGVGVTVIIWRVKTADAKRVGPAVPLRYKGEEL